MRTPRAERRVLGRAAFGTAVAAALGLCLMVPARAIVSDNADGADSTNSQQQSSETADQSGKSGNGQTADNAAAKPMEIGTRENNATTMSYGDDRVTRIEHPGATYIKVGFDDLKLAEGDYLTVSDPEGNEVHTYHGDPRDGEDAKGDANLTRHDEGLGAMSIQGDTAVVELHSSTDTSSAKASKLEEQGYGVDINGFWRGYDKAEMKEANPLSVCGKDARADAICYKENQPKKYENARAVAQIIIDGSVGCTAWRVGDGNTMLTNNHCLENPEDVAATEVQFDYECATCGGEDPKEPTKVAGAERLANNPDRDYALYSVEDFDSISDFGTLYLETGEPAQGEDIYIPGHGDLKPKRMSIFEEPGAQDPCKLTEANSGEGNLGYSCDTSGGNSGSPVISATTGKVIGLHHSGACPDGLNYGSRITEIYPEIKDQIDNGGNG